MAACMTDVECVVGSIRLILQLFGHKDRLWIVRRLRDVLNELKDFDEGKRL